jgi:hypothetical protein
VATAQRGVHARPDAVPLTVQAVVVLTLVAAIALSIVPGPLFSVFP